MKRDKVLLMVINVDWLFLLHRLEIAKEALNRDWRVVIAAKGTGKEHEIKEQGFEFVNIDITRSGTSMVKEFKTFFKLYFLYRKLQPEVVYQVTMKPVIYGTLVSKFLGISTLNSISGLGYNFTNERKGRVQNIMIKMMRYGFNKKKNSLVFENEEDCQELRNLNIINIQNTVNVIKGIGVNLNKFRPIEQQPSDKVRILLPTRMLWDKGVREFVEAAILLKKKYKEKAIFVLCGRLDTENKEAVPKEYLDKNTIEGYLEWIGNQEDMVTQYKNSDVVVLPSYREGLPVVLMEACAMGKPIVTTNAVGCKECVEEGRNGYKVPVKSVLQLAEAIEKLIKSPEERIRMGQASRQKAEKEFDKTVVVKKHVNLCEELLK
ncbi:glycosyltransferase family 4 protein [Wenyingzhuangia marina]|uniref:Glycosyltransferase involved in cell wall bisynthesis n=1 Tax=Wenyingzhuangia marina TaxID=1195760 RepID=A0A1M5WD46_9FLAO|nr:glycosyltransferase family 4 protein [Wenyingzhuangia marina]GGF81742.1 glycosyl transferase family 1 [Wenyingzhuangia marina]SHH85445.1 Glycosyltransferase involved in cell wall bisynthesis [Wenyingzhuangia marina]